MALKQNQTGYENAVVGSRAAFSNVNGSRNTAIGNESLENTVGGKSNTSVGYGSLRHAAGDGNIALGAGAGDALITGNQNILIGNPGADGESGTIRIGTSGTHTTTHLTGDVQIDGMNVTEQIAALQAQVAALASYAPWRWSDRGRYRYWPAMGTEDGDTRLPSDLRFGPRWLSGPPRCQ